ncbi:MAG: glycosyltransferase family 2 protein [Endomicrobiales bacterium]|nr:glycosyltransferase family 2 protein [Endomicrobiales bacterium]
MTRFKITAYVMTYNNADKIKDCLESINWADEIVVLDSFSTDGTVEIAKNYTQKIIQEKFVGFGRLRNIALSHCSNDWVFSLDSDERATEEIKNEIFGLLEKGPECEAYLVPRKSHFLDIWIRHCGWYPDFRQPQFFNKKRMKYREQLVHETYELDGRLGRLKEHVLQFPFFSLEQFFAKMDRYSALRAEEMFMEGRKFRATNLMINPAAMFFRMYVAKLGFLDGVPGFILSSLYAYYTMLKYVKLWEKLKKQDKGNRG